MTHTVGISEMRTSDNRDDVLVTYSLGSCIGLILYEPSSCVGGMIHCMLPSSEIDPAKAQSAPYMFVDTGVPMLIEAVLNMAGHSARNDGAVPSTVHLKARLAGAASLLNSKETFNIGHRNYIALRKLLWEHRIEVVAEETGGSVARTLYFHMRSGKTIIRSRGEERELT